MMASKGGIDYSRWDNLETSDEEDEDEQQTAPLKPVPKIGDLVPVSDINTEGAIECTGALEGLTLLSDPGGYIVNDESKVFRKADGTMIYGDLNGEHIVFSRVGTDQIPPLMQVANQGPRCFHGSSEEDFLSTSELQQVVEELVNKTVDESMKHAG